MNTFRKYQKIHRLGSDENEGILDVGPVYIQAKLDGANLSAWKQESTDSFIHVGSRSQDVSGGEFNGAVKYINTHEGIKNLLNDFPNYRLYLEWLIRHSISYSEVAYKKAYLFDIFDEETQKFLDIEKVYELAEKYNIETPKLFAKLDNPKLEDIMKFVGVSTLGEELGEGVVIKNPGFVNKYGDCEYAKIVTEKFKEENALVFGGNNKHSETYWEMYVCNKWMTLERVRKIMQKLQPTINKKLSIEDTARVINTAWHDLWVEESWNIQKKVPKLNFQKLSRLCCRKAAKIYKDILAGDLSIAYEKRT